MRVIKWWGTQSKYMKMLYIGSTMSISVSVSMLFIAAFVTRPSMSNYSYMPALWTMVVIVPVLIMGYIAYKLGKKEAGLKGAKEKSNDNPK